jgi:hypothetical protein
VTFVVGIKNELNAIGCQKGKWDAKRQRGCQKANEVPKGKWGAKRQMGCQKANGASKGKWGAKRQMRHQKANGVPKGKWGAKSRGSSPEFCSIFFSGGKPNFLKLSEEQKNRQTMNNTRLFF